MKYKIEVYSIMEFGQRVDSNGNPHQEDSIYPLPENISDSDRVFIVCDGMGGHDAGEVASATVCEAMGKSVLANAADPEGEFTDEMLAKAITDAFDALDKMDTGAAKKMGTTMTFLKLHDKGATIAHMGDSRVYHIRPGKDENSTAILFETVDHSLVNDLVKIGEMTPEEAKTSRQRNVITRAMQPNMERRPRADVYHTADIKPGDYFYMCTDGMLETADDASIKYVFSDELGDAKAKVEILRKGTEPNRDNHSAIIIHVLDVIDPLPVGESKKADTGKADSDKAEEKASESVADASVTGNTSVSPKPAKPLPQQHTAQQAVSAGSEGASMARLEAKRKKNVMLNLILLCAAVVVVAGGFMVFRSSPGDAQVPEEVTTPQPPPVQHQQASPQQQSQPVQQPQQPAPQQPQQTQPASPEQVIDAVGAAQGNSAEGNANTHSAAAVLNNINQGQGSETPEAEVQSEIEAVQQVASGLETKADSTDNDK